MHTTYQPRFSHPKVLSNHNPHPLFSSAPCRYPSTFLFVGAFHHPTRYLPSPPPSMPAIPVPIAEKSTKSMDPREMALPPVLQDYPTDTSYGAPIILSVPVTFCHLVPLPYPNPLFSLYLTPILTPLLLFSHLLSPPLFSQPSPGTYLYPLPSPLCLPAAFLSTFSPSTLSPPSVAAFTTAPPTCLSSSPSHNHLESVVIDLAPTSMEASTDLHPSSSPTTMSSSPIDDPFGLSSGIFRPTVADGLAFLVLPALPSPVALSPSDSFDSLLSVDTMWDPMSPPSVDLDYVNSIDKGQGKIRDVMKVSLKWD
ncbi:hypothetical protein AMTRI_Chr06g199350 [Amborella trichopoda]